MPLYMKSSFLGFFEEVFAYYEFGKWIRYIVNFLDTEFYSKNLWDFLQMGICKVDNSRTCCFVFYLFASTFFCWHMKKFCNSVLVPNSSEIESWAKKLVLTYEMCRGKRISFFYGFASTESTMRFLKSFLQVFL